MIYVFPLGEVGDVVKESQATLMDYGYDLSVVFGPLMSLLYSHAKAGSSIQYDMFTYLVEEAQDQMEEELYLYLEHDKPYLDEADKDILTERIMTGVKFLAAFMPALCYDIYRYTLNGRTITYHSMLGDMLFLEIV